MNALLAVPLSVLLVAQLVALVVLIARLLPGRSRRPPIEPAAPNDGTTVTVIVATLDEAQRIGPCLAGLMAQRAPLLETIVVDSRSTDGTRALVEQAARQDARIRLLTDDPLPDGWVGKVWALETGLRNARGEWILGIDADTVPAPGLVASIVAAAERDGFDVVSLAPRFVGQGAGERWVQPAMLVTLVYRCGAAGSTTDAPHRVLANGQCFLARRELLERHGGYAPARASFSDDVTLARHLAARGARVGFLDGSRVISVRSYDSLAQMWREWGRSFDLKDATPSWRRWPDLLIIWLVQALPLPVLLALVSFGNVLLPNDAPLRAPLLVVNAIALTVRVSMLLALRGSYERTGIPFWLSWLADIPAAIRLTISTIRTPRRWRSRSYPSLAEVAVGDS